MTTAKKKRKKTPAHRPRSTAKKAKTAKAISAEPSKVLVLRTCPPDMVARGSHEGVTWAFQWPRSGPVECPDWDPTPKCAHGLHGLLWGDGDWSLLQEKDDSVWLVVEVDSADLVKIDSSKVKFRRGIVAFAGAKGAAIVHVMASEASMVHARREAEAWQEKSGHSSTAASSGDSSTAASSGDYSTAASSGYSSTAACAGSSGIAASIGNSGMAKAGPLGLVIVTHWVEAEKRYRACVGNVGEGGIKADTWYRVVDGKLVAE